MRALIIILALLLVNPSEVLPHPGKVDSSGGHKCRRNCEERGLLPGEYHLHDEYGNAIRSTGDKPGVPETRANEYAGAPGDNKTGTLLPADNITAKDVPPAERPEEAVPTDRQITRTTAAGLFPYLPLLGLLLLLLLVLYRRRRRK